MNLISPNFYTFSNLLAGRVYAIADELNVTLIDAGLGLAAPRILQQLKAAGYAPEQVTRILITHAHSDHVGGLPTLRAATGAQVICSAGEQPVLEGDTPPVMPNKSERTWYDKLIYPRPQKIQPVPVDLTVQEGYRLETAIGPLQVLAAQGHTPGQIALWHPALKLLICGDAMMNLGGLRLPFSAFTQSMATARTTVKRLAALNPDTVCFGHGPVMRNAAEKVQAFAQKL